MEKLEDATAGELKIEAHTPCREFCISSSWRFVYCSVSALSLRLNSR